MEGLGTDAPSPYVRRMEKPKPKVPASADDPAESQRFIDMAREIGADEDPGALDRAFDRVVRPGKVTPSAPRSRRSASAPRSRRSAKPNEP